MQSSTSLFSTIIFLSKAGTGFFFFINTWIVISLTGSPSSAAVSLLIAVLPSIFLSMSIGSVADNTPVIKLILFSERIRFLTLTIYATIFMFQSATPLLAYTISLIMSISAEIQLISWRVLLAKLSKTDYHFKLNALSVTAGQAGVIAGATTSGMVFVSFGTTATVYTASILFLVSSILVQRLLQTAPNLKISKTLKCARNPAFHHFKAIHEGYRYIIRTPHIISDYLLILLNTTTLYLANALLAPFVKGPLNLSAEAYGIIDAAYSIGAIFGGLIIVRLTLLLGTPQITILGLSLLTLALLSFASADSFLVAFLSHIGIGLGCQTSIVSLSHAQKLTHPEFQGRVYAVFNTMTGVFGALIFLLSTHFTSEQDLRIIFIYQALIVATTTLAFIIFTLFKKH